MAKNGHLREALRHSRFSKANLIVFALVFAAIGGYAIYRSFAATSPNIYIAQSPAGTANGTSCANAEPAAFFNTATNWGSGNQIAPGTTVHLCGTIISPLAAQGSGDPSSPITILFEPNAKLSEPVCPGRGTGCLRLNNQSYITVDGGQNGVIEDTDSGTHLGHHGGSYGINATLCNNCEVKNLTIQNIYVHDGSANYTEASQTEVRAIDFSGSNFSFHDNTVHDAGWAINFGGDDVSNDRIYNNNIYNVDGGVIPSFSGTGSSGPFYIYNNHFHDFANWDTTSDAYHHDGIHCFSQPGSAGEDISGLYIYNNKFDGDIGNESTAWIFLEGAPRGNQLDTPCNNAASKIYIFNNILTSSPHWPHDDAISVSNGIYFAANNTIEGPDASNNGAGACFNVLPGSTIYNNAAGGCNQIVGGSYTPAALDNNAYADCTGSYNCFALGPSSGGPGGSRWTPNFADYQKYFAPLEAHSVANLSASVGSNAAGVGKNLTSMCVGDLTPLCSDINGSPRPATGAWDAGAVETTPIANVWVSPTGDDSNCTRGVQAKPCATFNKAYHLAQPGDTIACSGNFSTQQEIDKDPTKGAAGPDVTIKPAPGAVCKFVGSATNSGLRLGNNVITHAPPNHLTIDGGSSYGITFVHGAGISGQDASSAGVYTTPDNITLRYLTLDVFDQTSGKPIAFNQPNNLLIDHVKVGPSCCGENIDSTTASGSPVGIWITGTASHLATNVRVTYTTVATMYRNCTYWEQSFPAIACPQPSCPNSICHLDGIFMWGGLKNITVDHNIIEGGCRALVLEGNGNSPSSLDGGLDTASVYDNFIGPTPEGCGAHIELGAGSNQNSAKKGKFYIGFNTLLSGYVIDFTGTYDPSFQATVVGNYGARNVEFEPVGSTNYRACSDPADVNPSQFSFAYNIYVPSPTGSMACGATDKVASVDLSKGGVNDWFAAPTVLGGGDLHLKASGTALPSPIDFVPTSAPGGCPSDDIDGNARPQGSACDAGADEYIGNNPVPPNPPARKRGDINGDGRVDVSDLSALIFHFNQNYPPDDLDGNGIVNIQDLSILLSDYGK